MNTRSIWLCIVLCGLFSLSLSAQTLPPRKYPSLRLGLVIPGDYAAPTDQEAIDWLTSLYGSATANDVARFEAEWFDIAAGGNIPSQFRSQIIATSYVYFQTLSNHIKADIGLRRHVITRGLDWEEMYLHYREDTYLDCKEVTTTGTIFFGTIGQFTYMNASGIWGWLYPVSSPHDVFVRSDGGLAMLLPERVDRIIFTDLYQAGDPGSNGQMIIEYVNSVDSELRANGWGQVTIVQDTTNGLRQPGEIRFIPPTDWKWAAGGTGPVNGLIFASPAAGYLLRIRLVDYAVRPIPAPSSSVDNFSVRARPIVTVETTSLRAGQVISATANSVVINNNRYYRASNYYKDMTIEIVSGPGAGQVRTITGSDAGFNPRLYVSPDWDTVPTSASTYRITGPTVKVLGWDPANDRNGDGYVDDNEFANLVNPNATARFKWEARLKRGTEEWSSSNATCRPNLWNPNYRQALLEYYIPLWQSQGIRGYYNDDAAVLLQYNRFPVLQGGYLLERPTERAGLDPQTNESYRDAFLAIHQAFRDAGVEWVGTNVSSTNYFMDPFLRPYIGVFNLFLCEESILDTAALAASVVGVLRQGWVITGYAKNGVYSLVMGQNSWGNIIDNLGNTREAWERLTVHKLAQYYLINVPDKMFFQFWNRSYYYGSGLTTALPTIYWKAGVPKNMAYPPFRMLSVDIGEPANRIPEGYQAAQYVRPGLFTQLATTTQSVITLDDGYSFEVYPTYMFYLWRTPNNYGDIPFEAVIAREYTKGLVLYRAPAYVLPSGMTRAQYISDANAITVQLPGGPYRRVNYDGTLGPPVNEIQIRGYEGIILVKAAETSVPSIQLTMSVDKPNPRPLEVVTVTVTATNTGTGETTNVEVRIPLGNMTYEQGSLSPSDCIADTSERDVLKIRVPRLASGGTKELRFRAVVR